MKKIREDQLWDYAEGRLQGAEKSAIEQWLAVDPRNRQQLEEINMLSSGLQSMETEMPPMRFTARVMEAWDRELALQASPLQTHTDKRIVYAIATLLGGALLLTFGLLFAFSGGNTSVLRPDFSPGGNISGIAHTLGDMFAGFGHYFIGIILLLLMVLVERYLHYRHYIRSAE